MPARDEQDVFEVVPETGVPTPRLTGGVAHRADADSLVDAILAELAIHARNCVRAFGDFQFAISATDAVEPVLRRLMYDLNHRDFPWTRTRVWMVDEIDTADEEQSRWRRIQGLVLEQSGIPAEQVHRLRVTTPRDEGVLAYEAELRQTLGWREKGHDRLDFVLLPLSPLGGVAGFEDIDPADAPDDTRLVQEVHTSDASVSMTLNFVNAARMIGVVASGEAARPAVTLIADAVRTRRRDKHIPALWLAPLAGELRFYVDDAACPASTGGAP